MALNKIKTGSITDDAVNSDKLGAGSVTNTELNKTAITGQTELSEAANDADFTIIYDTSSGGLKKILRSNLKQSAPTVSSVSPTNVNESGGATATLTITGSGFTAGSTARLIGNTGKVQEFDTVTRSNTTTIVGTIAFSSLEQSQEPYDIQVTSGEGLSSLLANQININASPVFVTAAGSLGSSRLTMSAVKVNATDPDSAGNITFELQSGSLPAGVSLVNTAAEGGTAIFTGTLTAQSSDTVSNFVLRAVDNASNTASRAFSFTALGPTSQSFTSSGTFSVPSGITAADVLVVGGGGGTAPRHVGGGGAGGLIFMPNYPVTPGGTVSVTVGCGGAAGDPGGSPGQDSVFGTLTAKGGGGSGADGQVGSGGSGSGEPGPGGGTGSATQPTQPGNSGAYGFGNPGGSNHNPGGQGGGGGGAGAAGGNAPQGPTDKTGRGGAGKAYTIADGTTPSFYAGGGAGGGRSSPTPATGGCGGQGGGGQGGNHQTTTAAQSGQANKGGGGGGGSCTPHPGGSGGKGIVIVRY